MSEFDRDARLEEILKQVRQKQAEPKEPQAPAAAASTGVFRRQTGYTTTSLPKSGVYKAADSATVQFKAPVPAKEAPAAESRQDTRVFENFASSAEESAAAVSDGFEDLPEAGAGFSDDTMVFHRAGAAPKAGDRRSLLKAFAGADTAEIDAINMSALAPTIETGLSEVEKQIEEELAEEPVTSDIPTMEFSQTPESHPVFTSTFNKVSFIPEETPEERRNVSSTLEFQDTGAALDEMADEIAKKGVLNVQENAEDERFKTFFSDTVIIDDKPLRSRARRARKTRNIVVAGEQEEGPESGVFEEETAETTAEGLEYTSRDDIDEILSHLMSKRARAVAKTVITLILSLILIYCSVAVEYNLYLPDILLRDPAVLAIINAAVMLIAIFVNASTIFVGFGRLVAFKANAYSVSAFAAIMALVESVAAMTLSDGVVASFTAAIACTGLGFAALGDAISAKRVLGNFRNMSDDYAKFSSTIIPDELFTRRITRSLRVTDASVLVKRKTGFVDGFMGYSESEDLINKTVALPTSLVFVLALGCGVIGYFKGLSAYEIIRTIALVAAFASPFTSTLASAVPMMNMQKYLWKLGTVVSGFEAVDEITSANCVVMEGREIFPKGNVMLHGIKTFEKERIDKAILYAASVLIQSCDTMAHVFLNVIQGKTEMLYDVDSVVYEDGLGFSFWVDQNRVLLGKRELLLSHEIDVPSRDYENRYTKKSTRDAIYLAVSGKLYAMFVVSYAPNSDVEKALRGFEREGVSVLVRTRDFNVTSERIANMYHIPRSMVAVVPESDIKDLQKMTEYVGRTRSGLTHIGTISSFVGGILACYNVKGALKMATAIELACMLVGATLALALTVWGSLLTAGITPALGFQLVWLLVSSFLVSLRRY